MPVCLFACLPVCLSAPSKQAPVPNVAFGTDKKPAPKCSSHALKTAPQWPPSGRFRNNKTPWHWRTEAAPSKQGPLPNVAFWTDKKPAPKCSSHAPKTAPQRPPSGRFRNSKTPWHACLPVCLSVCLHLASRLQCLTLPSEPTRNQLQSAAPMPSKQLHNDLPAGGSETPKHHGTEGRKRRLASRVHPNVAFWTDKKPAPKCSSHALKTAPQRPPSGRFRNSKTPWHWRTEAAPSKQAPLPNVAFWADKKPAPKCSSQAALSVCLSAPSKQASVPNVAFWTDKKPAPKCSSHALKTASQRPPSGRFRNSNTPWHWRTEAAPSKQGSLPNVAFWTDKKPAPKYSSHALKTAPQRPPSGRFRNSKTAWHWRTEAAPSKQAPLPNVAFWADKKPAPQCSSHALKTAPQRSLSGRFRNSNTPWHACLPVCLSVCLHLASRLQCLTLPSEPTRNQLQSAAPMPSKQLHSDLPAGGSETPKHHGTEGRKRRLASRVHPNVAFWTDKKPAPKCSSHALKTAPQRPPSGRFRNSKTPWHWRTEAAPSKQAPLPNVAFWADKKPAAKCSSRALKTAPQRLPSGRFRNSKTPWHWRTEAVPSKQAPLPNVAFWANKKTSSTVQLPCPQNSSTAKSQRAVPKQQHTMACLSACLPVCLSVCMSVCT